MEARTSTEARQKAAQRLQGEDKTCWMAGKRKVHLAASRGSLGRPKSSAPTKVKVLHLRLSTNQMSRLKTTAKSEGMTVSALLRDMIDRLPGR